jgi:hypothetical protein
MFIASMPRAYPVVCVGWTTIVIWEEHSNLERICLPVKGGFFIDNWCICLKVSSFEIRLIYLLPLLQILLLRFTQQPTPNASCTA